MQYLLIISIFICCIIFWNVKKKDIESAYLEKRKRQLDKQIEAELADKTMRREAINLSIQERQRVLELTKQDLLNLRNQRTDIQKELQEYQQQGREIIDKHIAELKEEKLRAADLEIAKELEVKQQGAIAAYNNYMEAIKESTQKANEALETLKQSVEDYRAKQEVINQEILRRRELEEQSDFYRVCLSQEAIDDITLLQLTRQKLKKPEILDKIIYDSYVAKPVLEMIKRVLQNGTCSGIYKITCQETKEIYIGKSTDIKNRWQQHCKTAFNCGTIASSLLHRKMQQYGIENFTFELLEVVPKDQLSEREKFYINFYKTKEVGLNERNG